MSMVNKDNVKQIVSNLILYLIQTNTRVKVKKKELENGEVYWVEVMEKSFRLSNEGTDSKVPFNVLHDPLLTFKYLKEEGELYLDIKAMQSGEYNGEINLSNVLMPLDSIVFLKRLYDANKENEVSVEEQLKSILNTFSQEEGIALSEIKEIVNKMCFNEA